jgi:hypothetical protein
MIADIVYVLNAATCLVCALLLARGYRHTRQRLLLWSTLCFAGLFVNNLFTILDVLVLPQVSLHLFRSTAGFLSVAVLAFGLIGEER